LRWCKNFFAKQEPAWRAKHASVNLLAASSRNLPCGSRIQKGSDRLDHLLNAAFELAEDGERAFVGKRDRAGAGRPHLCRVDR
jgi:hypothetical protein